MTESRIPSQQDRLAAVPGGLLSIPDSVETPTLVVDLARVRENLADMASFARDHQVALVPHVKTHRTTQYARMQMEFGAAGICVAKLSEAEVFIDAGFTDVIMAYPLVGAAKIQRALSLLPRARLRLCTDDLAAARALSDALKSSNQMAEVHVLVDSGYGRTGVAPDELPGLAQAVNALAGIEVTGIVTHEGHAYGAASDDGLRDEAQAAGRRMVDAAKRSRDRGVPVTTVSVGSTATAKLTPLVDGVTEVRPGIYPFNDYGQVLRGVVGVERCAARVLATVVSHRAPDHAIIDAGSKVLGQDRLGVHVPGGVSGHGLLVGLPGWHLHQLSEEHGWLRWVGDGPPRGIELGQRVQVLPNHICSVFHEVGESLVIDDGEIAGTWTVTARGRSK